MSQRPAAAEFAALKKRLAGRRPLQVETPGLMETAVALILAPGDSGLEALFIRRAQRADDPWSGHIALPGGRREPGDSDRLAVAMRETREEVGVALPSSALLGALDDLHPSTPRLPPLVIRPFVFGLKRRPATSLSDEVAGVEWLALSALSSCEGKAEVSVSGERREVDCYRPDDLVIWGLTYRIVRGFLPLFLGDA
jgi:8-oxo-dGTP pyrophosphatase MutT (NUDIX family)